MNQRTWAFCIVLCVCMLALFVSPVNAQNFYGTLAGAVTDSSGAMQRSHAGAHICAGNLIRQNGCFASRKRLTNPS